MYTVVRVHIRGYKALSKHEKLDDALIAWKEHSDKFKFAYPIMRDGRTGRRYCWATVNRLYKKRMRNGITFNMEV